MGQPLKDGEDVFPVCGVQVAGGLVRQQDLGVHPQGPGDGHPLLLAAGEHGGVAVQSLGGQTHPLHQLSGPALGLFGLHAPQLHGVHDVFRHREQGEQPEALVDHRHLLPAVLLQLHLGGGHPLAQHLPLGGQVQPRHQGQQGGFAAARLAHDGVDPSGIKAVGDALEGLHLLILGLVGVADVPQLQNIHGDFSFYSCTSRSFLFIFTNKPRNNYILSILRTPKSAQPHLARGKCAGWG